MGGDTESAEELQLVVGAVLTVVSTFVLVVLGNRMYRKLLAAEEEANGDNGDVEDRIEPEGGQRMSIYSSLSSSGEPVVVAPSPSASPASGVLSGKGMALPSPLRQSLLNVME